LLVSLQNVKDVNFHATFVSAGTGLINNVIVCCRNAFFFSRIEGVPLWIKCVAQVWFFRISSWWLMSSWKGSVPFALFCSLSFRNSAVFSRFKIFV
jgi:hypothetical protein